MAKVAPPRGEDAIREVETLFERARKLRVLVVGETIIDDYLYCETLGKSGKEPILAARYVARETFAGGSLAVANHLARISDEVTLLSYLGGLDPNEDFIRARTDPKVDLHFLTVPNAPTILKRRFVEMYPLQKLFEIYVMDSDEFVAFSDELCAEMETMLADYDLVVVTDYGHGMIGPAAVSVLCEKSRFLAINTQMNADNRGFNTVSKYPRADFISVSETEMRLEARQRHGDLRELIVEVAQRLSCPRIIVTRGSKGCLCYDSATGFVDMPAFSSTVVDRVGAGDAVLGLTALCAVQGAGAELLGLVAAAVGAQAVATVGNRDSVDPAQVLADIRAHVAA